MRVIRCRDLTARLGPVQRGVRGGQDRTAQREGRDKHTRPLPSPPLRDSRGGEGPSLRPPAAHWTDHFSSVAGAAVATEKMRCSPPARPLRTTRHAVSYGRGCRTGHVVGLCRTPRSCSGLVFAGRPHDVFSVQGLVQRCRVMGMTI